MYYVYINLHDKELNLLDHTNKPVKIAPKSRIELPIWFQRYVPKYLKIVGASKYSPKPAQPTRINAAPSITIPQGTKVGVGILSYNRLPSIQRLLNSIRCYTDLNNTKVYVSDESTDRSVIDYLKSQPDIIVLTEQPRLGVAGNTNRLFRCLSSNDYNIILNDDVEVISKGWESFYIGPSMATGINHFCYRQAGIYGARSADCKPTNHNGYIVNTILRKPHGAVLFYTKRLFDTIGYFDERFGMYGMEHIDWSSRASRSGLCIEGFHDIEGSSRYFRMHNDKSAVSDRGLNLSKAKTLFAQLSNDRSRLYVNASEKSAVNDNLRR